MFESLRRRLIAALLTCAAPAVALCAESLPRSVLYLDENDPGLPFAIGISAAFRTTVNTGSADRLSAAPAHPHGTVFQVFLPVGIAGGA